MDVLKEAFRASASLLEAGTQCMRFARFKCRSYKFDEIAMPSFF
jgi:hypothetical protein